MCRADCPREMSWQPSLDGFELVFRDVYAQFLGNLDMCLGQFILLDVVEPEGKSVVGVTDLRIDFHRLEI